jgi:hypothetical protein
LFGSKRSSTHAPLHARSGDAHVAPHVPVEQNMPGPHAVPALPASLAPQPAVAPQKGLLVIGSTHVPLQTTCVPGQDTSQVPPTHELPEGQTLPQVPQLFGSLPMVAQ